MTEIVQIIFILYIKNIIYIKYKHYFTILNTRRDDKDFANNIYTLYK